MQGRLVLLEEAMLTGWALARMGVAQRHGEGVPDADQEKDAMKPLETPLEVTRVLDALAIPYVVGGSYASSLHGEPRSTRDCDLVVELVKGHLGRFCQALEDKFYLSRAAIEEALARKSTFNLIHFQTGFKIDIFVSAGRPFDRERMARALVLEVAGQPVRFSTAEDTILAKLEWQALSNSEQQWRDILGIVLLAEDGLDRGYLRHWATELGVLEQLEQAFAAVSE